MFDNRLKELRLKKGLNMKQAAILLNMPYTTYVGYEKNEREPNSEALVSLANFYNCSVDYLVGRSSQIKTHEIDFRFTEHEKEVIIAYRQQPSLQIAVDRTLGIAAVEEQDKEKRA